MILNLNFQDEGHYFANCLFYIPIVSRKCFSFQFLTRDILMYTSGVEYGRFYSSKIGDIFVKNNHFES